MLVECSQETYAVPRKNFSRKNGGDIKEEMGYGNEPLTLTSRAEFGI
jgi:hypothetical protein